MILIDDGVGYDHVPFSAEGRVEHQNQNQTATSQWPVGFVFGVQLDYSCRKKSDPADAENRVVCCEKIREPQISR